MFEGPIQELIDELARLPGIGPKSAQRLAFYIVKAPPDDAKRLAEALAGLPGVRITTAHVETNIVVFDIHETARTAADMLSRLKAEGLLLVAFGPATLRAVTHLDISNSQIEEACAILKKVFTT